MFNFIIILFTFWLTFCFQFSESTIIALRQRNLDKLENLANQISNPDSTLYGQYLSTKEINQMVSPPEVISMSYGWAEDD